MAARYGGDEFIVLLPESDEKAADEVTKRIRQSVYNASLEVEKKMIRTTASIGISTYPHDDVDPQKLVVAADRKMYEDKELRRPPKTDVTS